MKIDEPFIGRDREVAQLELAIGPGTDGLRLAMLVGPSGLGKTTLSSVVMEHARQRGFRVAIANGRAGSLSTPFVPWLEALPELAEDLAQPTLSDSRLDMEQLGVRLVARLADTCVDQPLLLVFDDAQALDESSLALLPYAVGVSEHMNVTILIVEQSDAIDVPSSYRAFVDGLLARRVVNRLELGPMSDDSIRALVGHTIDIADPAEVPAEIVLRAEGNPWFAKELAESWLRGDSEIPVNVAAAATARLNHLPDIAQDIVNAVALCPEGAHIGWLEGLADQKPRQFVRTMEEIKASGLIREDADFVSIAHPLMRQALIGELSAAMRRAVHSELAEIIMSAQVNEVVSARAVGYHLVACGKASEAVEQFLRAADANELMGQLHESLADLARALETEPRVEHRTDLLKRSAFSAMQIGDDRAVGYWHELGRLASACRNDELYAYALFQQYWTSYEGTAIDRLERAAALGDDRYGWSARASACIATLSSDYATAVRHDTRALELAQKSGDAVLEALTLEKLGLAYSYLQQFAEAIQYLEQAVQLASRERLHAWAIMAWGSLAETLAESLQVERSVHELRSALKYVDDLGLDRYRPLVEAWYASALLRNGQIDEATRYAESAMINETRFAGDRRSAIVLIARSMVAIGSGDVTVAGTVVADALTAAEKQGFSSWIAEAQFQHARLVAMTGDIDQAVSIASNITIDEPTLNAAIAKWFALVGARSGRPDLIERALDAVESIHDAPPMAELMMAEIRVIHSGFVAKAPQSVDLMIEIADRWNAAGQPVEAYRMIVLVAAVDLQLGNQEAAIQRYKDARDGLMRAGAGFDADYVAQQLRGLGKRSRAKSRSTTVGNLTKRELEIARLVASGLRNAEVAQQLYLAEKTVAAHLSNIYGKLEVRSRVQLTSWLVDHDAMVVAS